MIETDKKPPAVETGAETPVRKISSEQLRSLGMELGKLFDQYAADRRLTEIKWMRNLRQYLGIYDPEIENQLGANRSRAYPRVTRVKCISVLSRIMNLMFPGNERNWELKASPSAEMDPQDVATAVQELTEERQKEGLPVEMDMQFVDAAVNRLACYRAEKLSLLVDDQLQEIGGDQTLDYISLNRKVVQSGILYGVGVMRGPYVREERKTQWGPAEGGGFAPSVKTIYKPQYDFLPVWDFYPDMSARMLPGEGYFIRLVMGRAELRRLANRSDFFGDQIKSYLKNNSQGNYKPREFETELRTMGTKAHVADAQKQDPQSKYEVLVWNGPISAKKLMELGVTGIPQSAQADDVDSEIWLVDGNVIKADMNAWRKLGVNVRTVHTFVFDEDDTSPIGNGLPNVVRDSALSIAAATRMMLDNASVTCGPNLELNLSLLRQDQDLTSIEPYKIWYKEDDNPATANSAAVRRVEIDGHLDELKGMVEMFMQFSDLETFVGPATGGDMEKMPSEPMRTAAGASMLRGDAALPFKDIIRNFDSFTQSVILSLVQFNRKFNPDLAPAGDFNVIARGATSLIAKEVRGMQLDILAQSLTPDERDHIDERKFVEQRFAVRDMTVLMVDEETAKQRKMQRQQAAGQVAEIANKMQEATIRKTLADAYKAITQGQKNSAAADADVANTALAILESPLNDEDDEGKGGKPSK
jgi:hypothetical protein